VAESWKRELKVQEEEREKKVDEWRTKRNEKEREFAKNLQVEVNQLASSKREL
jgi:hypothetical protein